MQLTFIFVLSFLYLWLSKQHCINTETKGCTFRSIRGWRCGHMQMQSSASAYFIDQNWFRWDQVKPSFSGPCCDTVEQHLMYIAPSTSIYSAILQYYIYVHAPYKLMCLLGLHKAPDWCLYNLTFPPEVQCHYWNRNEMVIFCVETYV